MSMTDLFLTIVQSRDILSQTISADSYLPGVPLKPGLLPIGCRVVIAGLRNHGVLNGTVGRIVEFSEGQNRYEIRSIDTGQLFRVKPENILAALEPHEEPPEDLTKKLEEAEAGQRPALTISVGSQVELQNLRSSGWLNGQTAEVSFSCRKRLPFTDSGSRCCLGTWKRIVISFPAGSRRQPGASSLRDPPALRRFCEENQSRKRRLTGSERSQPSSGGG